MASSSDLLPGTIVGNYELEGLLGRGGMGAVYKANQLTLRRPVALKILHPQRVKDEKAVNDFMREAQVSAGMDHPGLVTVYDFGRDNTMGFCYFSMQIVMGRTLHVVVQQEGPRPWEQVAQIVRSAAAAVGHAHKRGIVHRDLKPGNVMMDQAGEILVTDLGLALDRFAGRPGSSRRVLSLVGTAEWSAPEQLRNPANATPASDVFALGAMAYFMLTGEEPFNGETLLDLVVAIATETPKGLEKLPVPAQEFLNVVMSKDPSERPQTGEELVAFIDELDPRGSRQIQPSGTGATPASGTGSIRAAPTVRRRRRRRR